jgi:tetratricopeptide (TPR) repeat protein
MSNRSEACSILLKQGRYDLAEKEIGRMLAENPEDYDAQWLMAWCKTSTGRYREAHEAADHAIRLDPQASYSYYIKATVFRDERKYKKTLPFYRRAISLDPARGFYYSELSEALLNLDRSKEALATAQRGLRRNPEDVACHQARTEALIALKRNKEALASAEKTLALDPQNPRAFCLKGELHLEGQEVVEAEKAFRQSLRLQPVNVRAQNDLEKVEEKIRSLRGNHWSVEMLGWLSLAVLSTFFWRHNALSVVAGVELLSLRGFWADTLKEKPGSRKQKAMLRFTPFLVLFATMSLVFFYGADPWYRERTAWFFVVFFHGLSFDRKEFINDQGEFNYHEMITTLFVSQFTVGLFSLDFRWFLFGLNGAGLTEYVEKLTKSPKGFRSEVWAWAIPLLAIWSVALWLGMQGVADETRTGILFFGEIFYIGAYASLTEIYEKGFSLRDETKCTIHSEPTLGGSHE